VAADVHFGRGLPQDRVENVDHETQRIVHGEGIDDRPSALPDAEIEPVPGVRVGRNRQRLNGPGGAVELGLGIGGDEIIFSALNPDQFDDGFSLLRPAADRNPLSQSQGQKRPAVGRRTELGRPDKGGFVGRDQGDGGQGRTLRQLGREHGLVPRGVGRVYPRRKGGAVQGHTDVDPGRQDGDPKRRGGRSRLGEPGDRNRESDDG